MAQRGARKAVQGQRKRQRALDLINEKPGAYARDLVRELGWTEDTGTKRLHRMCAHGELRREPALTECDIGNGKIKKVRTFRYWALRVVALTPEEVGVILAMVKLRREEEKGRDASAPGHYRHNDPNRPAIKCQGGQGSIRGPRMSSSIDGID